MSVLGPLMLLGALEALDAMDATARPEEPIEGTPSEHTYVEARYAETVIRGRPWVPHRRVATIARGTRLVVRGEVPSRDDNGCHGKIWYAVLPFGYVCSEHVRPSRRPPDLGPALPVAKGRRLPFSYASVRHEATPSFPDEASILAGTPSRVLTKGMSLAIEESKTIAGVEYVRTQDGQLVPRVAVGWMGQGSAWQGVRIDHASPGPLFGWTYRRPTNVRASPSAEGRVVEQKEARQRVPLLEADGEWWRVGDARWIHRDHLNEVHIVDRPEGVDTMQWVDVDVGEQVLVAYRGDAPEYATLVSSGRRTPTPLGNYPVWAKVASMDMANQGYEDNAYLVQAVPWVILFQGHNALHAAYWHDRFGQSKSHGCVNLAPHDAHFMFEWMGPRLPAGWTGFLPADLHNSPVVHVRDSSQGRPFTQERTWGPPDREEEKERLEEAERRRAIAAAEAPPVEVPSSPSEVIIPLRAAAPPSLPPSG